MERNNLYELYLMECVPSSGGGVYSTARRVRMLRACTMRDAVESFRKEIDQHNDMLEECYPGFWQCVESGIAATWRVECLFPMDIVSCFPEDDRYGQWN
jgi:hypothetical protein